MARLLMSIEEESMESFQLMSVAHHHAHTGGTGVTGATGETGSTGASGNTGGTGGTGAEAQLRNHPKRVCWHAHECRILVVLLSQATEPCR